MFNLFSCSKITNQKANTIKQEYGYDVSGYILTNKKGARVIVEKETVRWLDKDTFHKLMHP